MSTIKINNKLATKIVAHRGLSGVETENTNAAFVAAGNRSYYGIETDIHRTVDGRFVVCHDDNLSRIAGVDMDVESSTLSDLRNVILFDKDGRKDREDLRVSVLENYIAICKKYDKHCVLELKSAFTDEEIASILAIIDAFDYLENVTFISFNYDNLLKVRHHRSDQSVQFLYMTPEEGLVDRLVADSMDVDIHYRSLTKEMVDSLHQRGLKVNCWTVDNKETAEQLCAWGVDYITSNILE